MDGQESFPVLERQLIERSDDLNSRAADQHVDPSKSLDYGCDAGVDLRLTRDVHADAHGTPTVAVELARHGMRRRDIEVGDHYRSTRTRKGAGNLLADSARGPGDHGDLVVELH